MLGFGMANTDYKSVDDYIAAQPERLQALLQSVRAAIRNGAPDTKEDISYQIPAYKAPGGTVIFFAGWKEHFSLYPLSAELAETFKTELASYKMSKGTIRFPLSEPPPLKLIERLAKARAAEIAKLAEQKRAAKKHK